MTTLNSVENQYKELEIGELLALYRGEVSKLNSSEDLCELSSAKSNVESLETEIRLRTEEENSKVISPGQKWICSDENSLEFGLVGEVERIENGIVHLNLPKVNYLFADYYNGSPEEITSKFTRVLVEDKCA